MSATFALAQHGVAALQSQWGELCISLPRHRPYGKSAAPGEPMSTRKEPRRWRSRCSIVPTYHCLPRAGLGSSGSRRPPVLSILTASVTAFSPADPYRSTTRNDRHAGPSVAGNAPQRCRGQAFPVPVPSLDEQAEILRRVDELFERVRGLEARIAGAEQYAEGVASATIQKALAGKLVEHEAALASREGRGYESGQALLKRLSGRAAGAAKTT